MKKLTPIILKNHPKYNEKWIQEQIAKDPSILGLGDLTLRAKERIQSSGGRLDLLLEDQNSDAPKRYECEIQLGATDESHIIRTIEYWDLERKRYPQYDHTAILIAEDVTSRFLNVIHLFNGHIPLIVLKMSAFEIDGDITIVFTKILDEVKLGTLEDDTDAEPTDRNYWENRASKKMLTLTDAIFKLIQECEPEAKAKYNKYYIGIDRNGIVTNFVCLKPKKNFVRLLARYTLDDGFKANLENAGLDIEVNPKLNESYIKLTELPKESQLSLIREFISQGYKNYGL